MEVEDYIKRNGNSSPDNDHTDNMDTQKLIKNFGSYTTLHGFHFLFDSNATIRRLLWSGLMILCMVFLVINLKENYSRLLRHDSLVTKDEEHSRSLLFPAVTICNQNMLRKSKILGSDAQVYLDNLDYFKVEYIKEERQTNASFDIDKAVREAGHNLTAMMKFCLWRGQRCGADNFTTIVSFFRGLCYTFNSGAPGHSPLEVTSSGMSQSLSLILDVQPEEYYGPFSYEATGLKLLLHEQGEWPEVEIENLGLDVPPGLNTNIRIQRNKMTNLGPPFQPPCGTRKLVTTKTYKTSTCLMECYKRRLMDVCKCRFLGMPYGGEFNLSNFCNTEQLRDCIVRTIDKLNERECDCPLQCEKIKYSIQFSSAYFPSDHFWDTVYQLMNESINENETDVLNQQIRSGSVYQLLKKSGSETNTDTLQHEIRKRLLKVNIFYESLSTDVTTKKPAYDVHDLFSDMGGSMGLFLGCSLLTLCEFLDLLIMVCVRCCRAKKHRSQKLNHESVTNHTSLSDPGQLT